jgi:hypothetical protein
MMRTTIVRIITSIRGIRTMGNMDYRNIRKKVIFPLSSCPYLSWH